MEPDTEGTMSGEPEYPQYAPSHLCWSAGGLSLLRSTQDNSAVLKGEMPFEICLKAVLA